MKKTLALLLALILCMTAFGCSSVQSVSNDKQNSNVSADELTKGSSLTVKTTEIPEPTAEPTVAPTVEPTVEPTAEPTAVPAAEPLYGQIPSDIPAAPPEPAPTYDYEQMILDLFDYVNKGDIVGLANTFTPALREEELKAANDCNKEHNEGYYNFKHVDVLGIAKINERYFRPNTYFLPSEFDDLLLNTDNFDCYYVHANVDVYENKPFLWDAAGERGFVVTIVKKAEEWYLGTVVAYDPELSLEPNWVEYIDNFYDNMDK